MTFVTRRVYEPPAPDDGYRVLVDRLWPRGLTKERAALDEWAKDAAPSPDLRTAWHRAATGEWDGFADRYRAELDDNPAVDRLLALGRDHDRVTLLYAAHDPERNHAAVLRDHLTEHGG